MNILSGCTVKLNDYGVRVALSVIAPDGTSFSSDTCAKQFAELVKAEVVRVGNEAIRLLAQHPNAFEEKRSEA